jgi:hypothetical protein
MTDQEAALPPDVLAVFVELQRLVDSTVEQLPQHAGQADSVDKGVPAEVSTAPAATQTISPVGIPSAEAFGAPPIRLQEVERARSWLAAVRAAGPGAAAVTGGLRRGLTCWKDS